MKISTDQLWDEVVKVAAERPDYVYPDLDYCHYESDGQPACLVGHALHRLGVPVETLALFDFESGGIEQVVGDNPDLFEGGGKPLYAVSWAQQLQDEGLPWGGAVEAVKEKIE